MQSGRLLWSSLGSSTGSGTVTSPGVADARNDDRGTDGTSLNMVSVRASVPDRPGPGIRVEAVEPMDVEDDVDSSVVPSSSTWGPDRFGGVST
ncbi:hypothetical protein E4T56_gene18544 [Termitomyces sp. T112]|nr:hypothetical protein E4T56_gene18544 [Termitomyces sp. T112]